MRRYPLGRWLVAFGLLAPVAASAQGPIEIDPDVPAYTRASGVAGNLNAVGSDTLNNLMTLWAEGFRKQYPNVRAQIEGKGSSTAPPALISSTAQLGPMSREMKPTEVDQFEQKYGYKPTPMIVAIDALELFVNKDNPVHELTLEQVDEIFSTTRLCGGDTDITTWGQVGAEGEWAARPISLYGRNSASGTYGYFKEHALCKGDFRSTVKEQPGSASVVQGVSSDPNALGYSGMGYRTSSVEPVALAAREGAPYVAADAQNVYDGKYPLSRPLYVYVNQKPGTPLDPLVREFLLYVLSREGQEVVVKDGYLPLPASIVERERAKIR